MSFIDRNSRFIRGASATLLAGAALGLAFSAHARQEHQYPPVPAPNAKGVVVLFDGSKDSLEKNWVKHGSNAPAAWRLIDGGAMVAGGGDIVTKERFTDYQLHVEFKVPYMPGKRGQARGNSGVFQQGRYEIQVLDSFGVPEPGTGECGAVYSKAAPLVNACRPPKEWQTYDISFRAPRFDGEKMTEAAHVTVFLNGICVQNNTEIPGPTWGETFGKLSDPGPIVLQDHGNPMEYRNVWIMPLPPKGPTYYEGQTTIKD